MLSQDPADRVPLSVVVPVFNEREVLTELSRRIHAVASQLRTPHELILVDDGSSDGSWEEILALTSSDRRIKALRLSRNELSKGVEPVRQQDRPLHIDV